MTGESDHYGQSVGDLVPAWTKRQAPVVAAIVGRYCRLEPLDMARHAGDLIDGFMAAPDDRDWTWWRNPRPVDHASYIEEFGRIADNPAFVAYAVIDGSTGKAGGYAAYMGIDGENGAIELGGINYTGALKHSRAGTEALFLLMCHAFDQLGYRRLEWQCDSLNTPSRAAAIRLGFIQEGVFRQKMVIKGRNRDTAWFSLLDGAWPLVRRSLVAWLEPGNFDVDGVQRQSLAALRADFALVDRAK